MFFRSCWSQERSLGCANQVSPYLWNCSQRIPISQLRDPGDELVLEAAVNGHANAIVTFNQKDFGEIP
jgi:predicted nucleic acid-binding protein